MRLRAAIPATFYEGKLRLLALLAIALLAARAAFGQAEMPPERETKAAGGALPRLDVPKPKMSGKLTVQISGATAFTEKQLREAIAQQIVTIEQSGMNEANAYDAGFFLESHYRKHGYAHVTATAKIAGANELRLVVREGPLVRIRAVSIRGVENHTQDELVKYLLGPTRERFPRIKKDTLLPFVESDILSGAALVTRLYAADGFLDAVIESPQIEFSGDQQSAAVTLTIDEGTQYGFGQITFAGSPVYSREELANAIAVDLGRPFTAGRLNAAQRTLEDFYKKRGHFLAKVTAIGGKENAERGQVSVTFIMAPGPRHTFDGVTIRGLDGVRPRFIHNRLVTLRGKTYDPDLVDEKFRELIQTGLFKSLHINPQLAPGDQVRLDLEIEEAKPKEFGIGLGYASYEGAIVSLSYTDRNFLHTGRPITFEIEATSRGYKGEVLWSDPWFFESDYRFRARLYAQTKDNDGYSKIEYGFQPSLARSITKHWEVSAFLLAKQVAITSSTIVPRDLLGQEKYLANSIGISSTLDYRNNAANPSRGYIATATFDAASSVLSSDIDFVRATGRFSYYLPVTPKSVVAFGARGGVISPGGRARATTGSASSGSADLADSRLPIDERFFSGGASTVRSFTERSLGPKDRAGNSLGGEAFTSFNVEYTFPISGDLKGAVFADAGNVRPRAADFGLGNLRYALGTGLRYDLPFGPIRLDYGLNPSPHADESRGAFHFSIGVAF